MNATPMPAPLRGFVLCADDFAITEGVSRGILRLLEAGRISASGAMTNRPFWREGARALSAFSGAADLGVHLNLTCGAPLTHAAALAPGGEFSSLGRLLPRVNSGRIPAGEIAAELTAQLDAFEDAMGRAPDFIDGHQHMHAMPGIRRVLARVLTGRYGAQKPYLRDAVDAPGAIIQRGRFTVKALGIAALSLPFGAHMRAAGFSTNRGFAGFSAFDPAADYAADFARYLIASGPAPLIMCHPGEVDGELAVLGAAIESRAIESAFFHSTAFEDACNAARMRPMRFAQLPARGA